MFNKRKAGDIKYCYKKINSDVKNLQHVDIAVIEELFNPSENSEYREWSYKFSKKAIANDKVITAIKSLPIERQKAIVNSLVRWDGSLIAKFDQFLNDPEIALSALYPNELVKMPKKEITVEAKETHYYEVTDYDLLESCYHLFPMLGQDAKREFYKKLKRNYRDEEDTHGFKLEYIRYIGLGFTDEDKKDVNLALSLCKKYPDLYEYFSDEVKDNPEVIAVMMAGNKSEIVVDKFKNMPRNKQLEVVSKFNNSVITDNVKFLLEDKEFAYEIIKNNGLEYRSMLMAIKPEYFEDKKFLKLCIEKLKTGHFLNFNDVIDAIPQEVLNDEKVKLAILSTAEWSLNYIQGVDKLVNGLSDKAYETFVRENKSGIFVSVERDNTKYILEKLNELEIGEVGSFLRDMNSKKLSREVKLAAFVKSPRETYHYVADMDINFFAEAAMQNEDIINYIDDTERKNAAIITATTIKYLNKKFPKITSEKELDEVIEQVKKNAKKKTSTKKATIKKTTEPNTRKGAKK